MNFDEAVHVTTRRMVWDLARHSDIVETLRQCSMVPGSGDLLQIEHLESHERTRAIAPLVPTITTLAAIAAEPVAVINLPDHEDLPDGFIDAFDELGPDIIAAGCVAVLAQLMALGLIHTTARRKGWFRV